MVVDIVLWLQLAVRFGLLMLMLLMFLGARLRTNTADSRPA